MKTQFTLLLISLSLVGQAQERNFVLMGRIIGADSSKKAILTRWDIGRTDTSLIHNGQFIFKGQVRHPTLATVGTDKVHQGLGVWLSNDTIRSSFKIDGRLLQPVAVVGPPESEDYLTNINQINTYSSSGLSTPRKNQQIADLISQYVRNHTNSYYSLFLLTTNTRFLSLSQSKELTASLSSALQNSEPGKSLESQLRNEAATAMNKVIDSFSLLDTNGVLRTVIPTQKPYTLLSFWASWCAPCRAHNQDLVKLYQRIDHSQIELISISLDDNRKAWLKAIAKDGLKWEQLSYLKYLSGPVAKQLALYAVPQVLLVDRSNKIVAISLHDAIQVIDKK